MHVFPYSTYEGKVYIFSALDCECSTVDFENAVNDGTISSSYKTLLVANMYGPEENPKPAYWATE
jgi:hypothetical protein